MDSSVPARLLAVPARDVVETVHQPDGTAISVRQFGDEWVNGHRTLDGYMIMRDASTGLWKYAEQDANGDLRHSLLIVGRDLPVGIRPGLAPRAQRAGSTATSPSQQSTQVAAAAGNFGAQPLLVIFADFTPSVRAGSTAASLYSKFFGASGSVKNYYETALFNRTGGRNRCRVERTGERWHR